MDESTIQMPHSRNAEETYLGSLLIDSALCHSTILDSEDFYIRRNGMIFSAMLDIFRGGNEPDFITVCALLDERKQLGEIGGAAYVMQLISSAATSMHAASYEQIIKTRSLRRRIIYAAQKLTVGAFDLDSDLTATVSAAMDQLTKSIISNKRAVHIEHFVTTVFEEVDEAIKNPKEIFGIPTGIPDIDRITYGWQRGEKIVLSGEPGVGKSVIAAQFLVHAAKSGIPGALFEMEMSGRQVVRRVISGDAKVQPQKLRQGKLSDQELNQFMATVHAMTKLPIFISDASEMTTAEMRADLIRLVDGFGVQFCVIDYEGLLGDDPEKDDNTRSKIISKRVHDIAKDLNLAVIAIADMNKSGIRGETKGQASVAGTARSLHDADQIIVIRKTEQEGIVRLTWEKNREGESDRFVDLLHLPGYPAFGPVVRR